VHDVDDRRAVALDRGDGHLGLAGLGPLGLAERGAWVDPLAVLLVAVKDVRVADQALVDQVLGVHDGRGVAEGEAELGLEPLGRRQLGRAGGLPGVAVHRLLAQHVLAGLQGVPGDLEVGLVAGGHVDHVDRGVVEELTIVGDRAGDAELLGHPAGEVGVRVHYRGHLDARVALPAGDMGALGPAAGSDDGDP
jgi:hypothetical protein